MTLTEILMALLVLAMAVFPLIRSFTQNQALAVRQLEKEIALKVAEAALNAAMSGPYDLLTRGSGATGANLPLRVELPNQPPITLSVLFDGPGNGKTTGTVTFRVGPTDFTLTIDNDPLYGGPGGTPLGFRYGDLPPGGAPATATYSCPPDELVIRIKSGISWSANNVPQNITLESCRVKLSK